MSFPPSQEHRISLSVAAEMTRRYRESAPAGAIKAGMFPRSSFETILKQPGCLGIRIYFGRNSKGELSLVMVGVDSDGRDMTQGELMDNNLPCPPFCDDGDKALNG